MIIELAVGLAALLAMSAIATAIAGRRGQSERNEVRRPIGLGQTPHPSVGLNVGDVVLRGSDELWLTAVIELDEDGSRLRLFRASKGAQTVWVAQLDDAGQQLALLSESAEIPEGNVPDRLPVAGRVLSLRRKGRAEVRTRGEPLPPTSKTARFTLLGDAGGRLAIVIDYDEAPRLALVGDRVERARIDVLPGDLRPGD
jgi:hypothetical protein